MWRLPTFSEYYAQINVGIVSTMIVMVGTKRCTHPTEQCIFMNNKMDLSMEVMFEQTNCNFLLNTPMNRVNHQTCAYAQGNDC